MMTLPLGWWNSEYLVNAKRSLWLFKEKLHFSEKVQAILLNHHPVRSLTDHDHSLDWGILKVGEDCLSHIWRIINIPLRTDQKGRNGDIGRVVMRFPGHPIFLPVFKNPVWGTHHWGMLSSSY
jgi:hypothetical protein